MSKGRRTQCTLNISKFDNDLELKISRIQRINRPRRHFHDNQGMDEGVYRMARIGKLGAKSRSSVVVRLDSMQDNNN